MRARLRATPELWTFKVVVNDGVTRLESSGPIEPQLGECLRVLQVHIKNLSSAERAALLELTGRVIERVRIKP